MAKWQRDVVGVTTTPRVSCMNADMALGIVVSGMEARMRGYMRRRGVNV
jgi:hypothetical protein